MMTPTAHSRWVTLHDDPHGTQQVGDAACMMTPTAHSRWVMLHGDPHGTQQVGDAACMMTPRHTAGG